MEIFGIFWGFCLGFEDASGLKFIQNISMLYFKVIFKHLLMHPGLFNFQFTVEMEVKYDIDCKYVVEFLIQVCWLERILARTRIQNTIQLIQKQKSDTQRNVHFDLV
ncbi:Hypothetical_protein [Hexamita inflata]|uniref:Hypothetical_protein n=1 Tax=Hexamita inflata TaxID=28002 RepID=A0ABP1HI60_9EUKA